MKKIFVIFLSLIYLVMSSGFTRYSHTCKAMAVKTYSLTNTGHQASDDPCPICSSKKKGLKKKKEGCCEHESKTFKVDDGIKKQLSFDFLAKFCSDAIPNELISSLSFFSFVGQKTKESASFLSSKIPIRGNPLYILHCVYRI